MPRGGRGKSSDASGTKARRQPDPAPAPAPTLRPLKPRPMLLAVMSAVFALWMGLLILLYFKTIPPH